MTDRDVQKTGRARGEPGGRLARESFETFKEFLLFEQMSDEEKQARQEQGSERALQTLIKWGKQLSSHRGKFGSFMMIALGELDFDNEADRQEFRKSIENEFGRYVARATDRPTKRMTKKAVKQRGREAGANPEFKTRAAAREFAKDQNTFRRTRKVADAGKGADNRWRAPAV